MSTTETPPPPSDQTETSFPHAQWSTDAAITFTTPHIRDYRYQHDAEECPTGCLDLATMDQPERTALATVISLMAIIIAMGSIGNLMVIVAVLQNKKLRTTPNMFVVNLSVCDLLFVTTVLPFNIYTYIYHTWRLNMPLCTFVGFLGYTLTGTTILTITLIAWNRYKMVVDTSNHKNLFNNRYLILMLASTWVLPALSLQVAVFKKWGQFGYVQTLSSCNLAMNNASQSFKIFLLVIRAAIPSSLIIYFYAAIYATTHTSHRRLRASGGANNNPKDALHQHNTRQEMRLTRMMAGIFVVFALSYFPCTVSSVIDFNRLLSKTFHLFCQTSVFLGSAINPLLYGLMNERFRHAYCQIVTCSVLRQKKRGGKWESGRKETPTSSPNQTRSTKHRPTLINLYKSKNHLTEPKA